MEAEGCPSQTATPVAVPKRPGKTLWDTQNEGRSHERERVSHQPFRHGTQGRRHGSWSLSNNTSPVEEVGLQEQLVQHSRGCMFMAKFYFVI